MRLTDYYRFERKAIVSKSRLDCAASTLSYPEFEEKRATKPQRASEKRDATNVGDLIVYFLDVPQLFKGDIHSKADKNLTIKGKNLSSIFVPDPALNIAYGDVKGTADAILFIFNRFEVIDGVVQPGASVEVLISRGMSKDRLPLYNLLKNGELDEEIALLRGRAIAQPQGVLPLY